MTKTERLGEPMGRQGDETLDIGSLTADDLKGANVYDRHEATVGTVSDVIMADDGTLENLVVDIGGFLGLAQHTVGIGARKVSLRRGEDDDVRIYLKMTDDELRDLPATGIPAAAAGYRT